MTNYLLEINNFIYNKLEDLIKDICIDLDKKEQTDNIIEKYLKNNNFLMKKKKSVKKNKRKKTAYSMFLKYNTIRKENPDMSLESYNIYKGEYWKNISVQEKSKYAKLADEWNQNNKTTKQMKIENNVENKEINILDCFFDDEYLKDKEVKSKIEEI